MKVVTAREGKIVISETEIPECGEGCVIIRTEYSAVSPGT